jgi:hypothetical protein
MPDTEQPGASARRDSRGASDETVETHESVARGLNSMFITAVPLVTATVAAVYLAYWVFTDAPSHGLDPYRWALIAAVLPAAGLLLYLQRRAKASDELEDEDLFGFTKHQ